MTLLWNNLAKGADSPFWLTFLVQNMLNMIRDTPAPRRTLAANGSPGLPSNPSPSGFVCTELLSGRPLNLGYGCILMREMDFHPHARRTWASACARAGAARRGRGRSRAGGHPPRAVLPCYGPHSDKTAPAAPMFIVPRLRLHPDEVFISAPLPAVGLAGSDARSPPRAARVCREINKAAGFMAGLCSFYLIVSFFKE